MALNGIDVSSYQSGIGRVPGDFRIIKATEGTDYKNPALNQQISSAPGLLGFYHFADNGNVHDEAMNFINHVEPYLGKALLVLDYEPSNPNPVWAKQWLDYVYMKTGVRPLIYISLSTENNYDWSSVASANYGLWVSQYNNYNTVNGYSPRDIYGKVKHWKSTAMFQYSSSGRLSGYNGNLDLDVFYGNANSWKSYAKISNSSSPIKPTPKPKPKPAPKKSFVDSLGVTWYYENGTFTSNTPIKLRYGARTTSDVITTLPAGSKVKYDAYCFSGGYVWIRQPRSGNDGYMATGETNGNKRVSSWGTFK